MKHLLFILLLLPCLVLSETRTKVDITNDTYMQTTDATGDFSASATLTLANVAGNLWQPLLMPSKAGIYDTIGVTATASTCTLYIYCNSVLSGFNANARKLCKPATDIANHNTWDGTQDWGAAGAADQGANCLDCYNTSDGSGDDYTNPWGTYAIQADDDGKWLPFPFDTCHTNDWIAKRDTICGIKMYTGDGFISATLSSIEGANPAYLVINWSLPAEGDPNALRTPDGPGLLRSPLGGSTRRGPDN